MTAVDADALAKLREAWAAGGWPAVDAMFAVSRALPDLLAEVRRGRALREAVEGLAEEEWDAKAREWAAEADNVTVGGNRRYGLLGRILGTKAAAQRLRAVLAAVDAS